VVRVANDPRTANVTVSTAADGTSVGSYQAYATTPSTTPPSLQRTSNWTWAGPVMASGLSALASYFISRRQDATNRQISRDQIDATTTLAREDAAERRRIADEAENTRVANQTAMANVFRRPVSQRPASSQRQSGRRTT
jgi:hypothetical protein